MDQNCALVGKKAPNFTAVALFPDKIFREIKLSDFEGYYVVLYFYPLDFTFVCPTEIIAFDSIVSELEKRGTKLFGCSVDSQYSHLAWVNTPREKGGLGSINHPLISDITKNISKQYGVLQDEGIALRGLFFIDNKGIIRHAVINDLKLGRSSEELLRVVDAWQQIELTGEVCPANWKKGSRTLGATQEDVSKYLSDKIN